MDKNGFNKNIFRRIVSICDSEYRYFLRKCNVVGIGFGYKITNGRCTFKSCIKVFVCRKINNKNLLGYNLVPFFYKGIQTDVVDCGIINTSSLTNKIRPVIGGYNIGAKDIKVSGSLGCLVKDKLGVYLLSNNHTIAYENKVPLGTSILQPSLKYGGKSSTDKIATLSSYVPLKFKTPKCTPVNYVDCAIAKIENSQVVNSDIAFIGKPRGKNIALVNERVQKVGCITEHTFGITTSVGCTFEIEYKTGRVLLKDQIATTKMSDSGDSGAVLLDLDNNVLGLLAGTGTSLTIFNSIERVLNSFKVSLVIN